MIRVKYQKSADALFGWYLNRLFKKSFYAIWLQNDPPKLDPNLPLLLLPNHSTWWDGFFAHLLTKKIFHRPIYLMMLQKQLAQNRFFSRVGAFSIDPSSAIAIRESLNYTVSILKSLDHPKPLICIFPQGVLAPWDQRPLGFKPGVEFVLARYRKPLSLLFLGIKVEFLAQQFPEVFFRFGTPRVISSPQEFDLTNFEREAESVLNEMVSHIHLGKPCLQLFRGRQSVNETFGVLRKRFQRRFRVVKNVSAET